MVHTPTTEFVFEALVTIGPPLSLGETAQGLRRVIPITGGRFKGPLIEGEVVPGGADWQTVRPDGCTVIEAIYAIKAADGAVIAVRNKGLLSPVDGAAPYVRTVPEFDAPRGPHAWLNRSIFVGTLAVADETRTAVRVRVFRVV